MIEDKVRRPGECLKLGCRGHSPNLTSRARHTDHRNGQRSTTLFYYSKAAVLLAPTRVGSIRRWQRQTSIPIGLRVSRSVQLTQRLLPAIRRTGVSKN